MKITKQNFEVGTYFRLQVSRFSSLNYLRDKYGDVFLISNDEIKKLFSSEINANVEVVTLDDKFVFFSSKGHVYSFNGIDLSLCSDDLCIEIVDAIWESPPMVFADAVVKYKVEDGYGVFRINENDYICSIINFENGIHTDIQFDESGKHLYVTDENKDGFNYFIYDLDGNIIDSFESEKYKHVWGTDIYYNKNHILRKTADFYLYNIQFEDCDITHIEVTQGKYLYLIRVITNKGVVYLDQYLKRLTSFLKNDCIYLYDANGFCYICEGKEGVESVFTDVYYIYKDEEGILYLSKHINHEHGIKMISFKEQGMFFEFIVFQLYNANNDIIYSSRLTKLFDGVDSVVIDLSSKFKGILGFADLIGVKNGMFVKYCEYSSIHKWKSPSKPVELKFICDDSEGKVSLYKGDDNFVYVIGDGGVMLQKFKYDVIKESLLEEY